MAEESALEAGLGGDEECGALGGEGVGFVGVFGEELQAYEDVHDGGEAADGGSSGSGYFGDRFGAGVEDVEDSVANSGFEDQGGDVAPGELHDAFG